MAVEIRQDYRDSLPHGSTRAQFPVEMLLVHGPVARRLHDSHVIGDVIFQPAVGRARGANPLEEIVMEQGDWGRYAAVVNGVATDTVMGRLPEGEEAVSHAVESRLQSLFPNGINTDTVDNYIAVSNEAAQHAIESFEWR